MMGTDKGITAGGSMSEARAPYYLTVADPILGLKWWLGGGVGLSVHLLLVPFSECCGFCNPGKVYEE